MCRRNELSVTVLSENTGFGQCEGQHGLSLYIRFLRHRILLDAGQSRLFAENAKKLGINLKKVDLAVLSHAHYDHADGFDEFLLINKKAKLYVRKEAEEIFYADHDGHVDYIGPRKGMLAEYADRVVYVDSSCCYLGSDKMFLVPHSTEGLSDIGEKAKLYKLVDEKIYADDFEHEQSLVISTKKGLVIFNSCSHGGPANIIKEVQKQRPGEKIYAYIGGFHLSKYPDEDVYSFAETLKEVAVDKIITGHCTGDRAFEILREKLGERVEKMHSGLSIEL